jgi:hypothetical protein
VGRNEIRDVEDHAQQAVNPGDEVELRHRQVPEPERDRDRRHRRRAPEVGDHHQRPPAQPVDPDPGRQREEQEREHGERAQQRDTERPGAEHVERRQRQGEQ